MNIERKIVTAQAVTARSGWCESFMGEAGLGELFPYPQALASPLETPWQWVESPGL